MAGMFGNDPYGGSRNMASALGNFQQMQGQMLQNTQQQQMQQQAQMQQQQQMQQPPMGNIHTAPLTPHKGFTDHQNKLVGESRSQEALAHAMRQKEKIAGTAALKKQAESEQHEDQLKALTSNKIVAKHPLDLLAIGIQGWKARKLHKKASASKVEAAQAAQQMKGIEEQRKTAQEDAQWLYRQAMSMEPDQDPAVTLSKMKETFMIEDQKQAAQDIPPSKRTYSVLGSAGKELFDIEMKKSQMAGTGVPVKTKADTSKDVTNLEDVARTYDRLTHEIKTYDPKFFGLMGVIEGKYGAVMDFLGAPPDNASVEFMSRRNKFRSGIQSFANELIKLRSGAAVTKQEFDRFLKEYPLSEFKGQKGFESSMDAFVNRIAKEQYSRMRTAGWVYDSDGSLVYDERAKKEGVKPIIDTGYSRNSTKFWDDYNNQDLPENLFNKDGEFHGFSYKGDKVRGGGNEKTSAHTVGGKYNGKTITKTGTQNGKVVLLLDDGELVTP